MTAARQFRTMSVGTQTLLFVEGSLPESATQPEPEPKQMPASTGTRAPAPTRPPFRKGPRPTQWETRATPPARSDPPGSGSPPSDRRQPGQLRPGQTHREFPKRPATRFGRRADSSPRRPWQPGARKPPSRVPSENADDRRPHTDPRARTGKPFASARPASGPRRPPRNQAGRANTKPWQRRTGQTIRSGASPKPDRKAPSAAPESENRARENRPFKKTWRDKNAAPSSPRPNRPRRDQPRGQSPRPVNRPFTKDRPPQEGRPFKRPVRAQTSRPTRDSRPARGKFSRPNHPRPRNPFGAKPRSSSSTGKDPGKTRSTGPSRPFSLDRARPRPDPRPKLDNQPSKKAARKPNSFPGKRNPRKNRSQEENPE
jgi:hypothetical protein